MERPSVSATSDHTCPVCSRPILDRELVYFDQGQVIHAACGRSGSSAADAVGTFLRDSPGRRICHDCLAQRLTLQYPAVRKATTALRLTEGFLIELGAECASCARIRVTISYRHDLAEARPRPR